MLRREKDWLGYLGLAEDARASFAEAMVQVRSIFVPGMMHETDISSLVTVCVHARPKTIFEIGTYKGASAELFLRALPQAKVISIAYPLDPEKGREFNNSDLRAEDIGSLVSPANRSRYTQLLGDSHKIDPDAFVRDHGQVDLVFIDGDHSREGVRLDTELALRILAPGGAIAWHDANPKRRYLDSRRYLEEDMTLLALATTDDFIGGIAYWTAALEQRLRSGG